MAQRDAFCSFCGHAFGNRLDWPRQCERCRQIVYRNPLPVGVALLPVEHGLLAIRRSMYPHRGKIALPGGYINYGETWQEGTARELFEEANISIDPYELEAFAIHSIPPGLMIVFGLAKPRRSADLSPFIPNEETLDRLIIDRPVTMAFELHSQIAADFFQGRRGLSVATSSDRGSYRPLTHAKRASDGNATGD